MAGAMGMKGLWGRYQANLAKYPVRTQMITSAALWVLGDAAAQSITHSLQRPRAPKASPKLIHQPPEDNTAVDRHQLEDPTGGTIDWRRVATAGSFGFGFVGPVGHFWYEGLEALCIKRLKLQPKSLRFLGTKLFSDTFIFGPVHLLTYFTYMGLAAGKPFDQVKRDVRRDFLPSFMTEGVMWMCVQVCNFRFVPVRHQLLVVNFFCLIDSAFLSWVKHQEDAPWKRWLTSIVSSNIAGTRA